MFWPRGVSKRFPLTPLVVPDRAQTSRPLMTCLHDTKSERCRLLFSFEKRVTIRCLATVLARSVPRPPLASGTQIKPFYEPIKDSERGRAAPTHSAFWALQAQKNPKMPRRSMSEKKSGQRRISSAAKTTIFFLLEGTCRRSRTAGAVV